MPVAPLLARRRATHASALDSTTMSEPPLQRCKGVLQRLNHDTGGHACRNGQVYKAAAEYEVQGLKLRESSTESHKFYVTGPNEVQLFLKCETPYAPPTRLHALRPCPQHASAALAHPQ